MKYRWHRGGLSKSMETVVSIDPTKEALANVISNSLSIYGEQVTPEQIKVKPYGYDNRIGWNTHIVTIDGKACGFTDGPIEE